MKTLTATLPAIDSARSAARPSRLHAGDVMVATVGVIVTMAGFFRSEISWFLAGV